MKLSREEMQRLSVAERIELIGAPWESSEESGDLPALTEVQRAELERRLALYSHEPDRTRSWSDVRARLEHDE